MKIQKFQADEEGVIKVQKCIAVNWVGMQKDIPTLICLVGEGAEAGKNLSFYVKQVGDNVSIDEMQQVATALVTADAEFILFSEKPKIVTGGFPNTPPGMSAPGRSFHGV